MRKAFGQYEEFYQLKNLKIIMEKNESGEIVSEAIVKLSIGEEIVHTAAGR